MEYSLEAKNARLAATRALLDGGTLEIGTEGMAMKLAEIKLDAVSGAVVVGTLIFNGFPKYAMAEASGRAAMGQLKNSEGRVVVDKLTIGIEKGKADIVMREIDIASENVVKIDAAEIRHA